MYCNRQELPILPDHPSSLDYSGVCVVHAWDIMITTEKKQSNFAKKSYDSKFI
jgi:hypothetical protein